MYFHCHVPFSVDDDGCTFQDTGVSVRKRVIKIMKDICVECPDFPKIPEICVKMIRRVNDEEGIRKLVMEVFQVRLMFSWLILAHEDVENV